MLVEASPREVELLTGGGIALAALFTAWNTVGGAFVWDDRAAILSNGDVSATDSVWSLLTHDFWGKDVRSVSSHKSYRPLTVLTFRWNYQLFGYDAHAYHAANAVLHAACSVLVWRVALKLFSCSSKSTGKNQSDADRGASCGAVLAALLFAVHPIHCDAVASVVGRADVLCALFVLLAFIAYSNAATTAEKTNWRLFAAAMASAIAACFCKELGFTTFGLLFAHEALLIPRYRSVKFKFCSWQQRTVIIVVVGGLLACLRVWINGEHGQMQWNVLANAVAVQSDRTTRMLSYAHIHAWYIWKLVWPRWLSFDYGFDTVPLIRGLLDSRNLQTAVAYGVVLGGLGGALWQYVRTKQPPSLVMSIAFGLIPFAPASNVFFPVGTVVAERLLYLPSVGFCLLVGNTINSTFQLARRHGSMQNAAPRSPLARGTERRRRCLRVASHTIAICCAFLLVFGCYRSRVRNAEWSNETDLYEAAVRVTPTNVKVLSNTAKTVLHSDPDRAIHYLRVAGGLSPDHTETAVNLGLAFSTKKMHLHAIRYMYKATRLSPEQFSAPGYLGNFLLNTWQAMNKGYSDTEFVASPTIQRAIEALDHAIHSAKSIYPSHYYTRGYIAFYAQDYQVAIRYFEATTQANALIRQRLLDQELIVGAGSIANMIAVSHLKLGDELKTIELLERGSALYPEEVELTLNLILVYIGRGELQLATTHLNNMLGSATTREQAPKLRDAAERLRALGFAEAAAALERKTNGAQS